MKHRGEFVDQPVATDIGVESEQVFELSIGDSAVPVDFSR